MPLDNLHPGVHIALARSRMDEAQVARAIASGELTSPQQYGNSWLFDLRITGTGSSYRAAHDEYVWRDPSLYLNKGFLDRCNGLPIIAEHPEREMLNTGEYRDRNLGSIIYPYIKGDEVWGIGRIIDQPAARYMRTRQVSTSPAVVFLPKDGNEKIPMPDGKHLLIEGKPSLLDHLAVCDEGVWDKGGPPSGVVSTETRRMDEMKTRADSTDPVARLDETDEERLAREKMEEEARSRRDDSSKMDRLINGIGDLTRRLDKLERGSRHDMDEEDRERGGENSHKEDRDDPEDRDRKDNRGRRPRRDASSEEEAQQAKELHELAEEEEEEAHEEAEEEAEEAEEDEETEAGHDADEDEESEEMPWEEVKRRHGESDSSYSRRVDTVSRYNDKRYAKRDDESIAAHCDRVDRAFRNDRARRDAQRRLDSVPDVARGLSRLISRLDRIESRLQDRSDDDEIRFADVRARADAVYEAFSDHAPRPMRGENLIGYRIRLARGLQKHSSDWKGSDIAAIARSDTAAFENIETAIYNDAMTTARQPTNIPAGTLREIRRKQPYGGEIIEFAGDPLTWMQSFMLPAQAARLNRNPTQQS